MSYLYSGKHNALMQKKQNEKIIIRFLSTGYSPFYPIIIHNDYRALVCLFNIFGYCKT